MTNAAHSTLWLGLRARCLALTSILAILVILGTVPLHGAEGARPGIADRCSGGDCASRPVRGVTVYRGLVLDYEVIDGLAVHGGDMVLGTAEEAAAAAPSREPEKREANPGPVRRELNPIKDSYLWPDGRVPYVIHEDLEGEDLEVIHAAIEEWNTKTVIDWFPRTDEQEYALFGPLEGPICSSSVGRGSPTTMSIEGCSFSTMIHEMGHAVGLFHEHQRPDRDRFIQLAPDMFGLIPLARRSWLFVKFGPPLERPYDYRSIMHYFQYDTNVRTIPPGIWITGDSLSAGDIDGVARLYGKPPGTVTVSTNPPGLDVIVDGQSVTTPATFDWLPDSVHTLEAPLVQPFVFGGLITQASFGRWSDGGDRKHTVRAGPDSTWFEANFFLLKERVGPGVVPRGAGTVASSPEIPDGLDVGGNPVEYTPIATEGTPYEFARWCSGSAHFGIPPFYRIRSNIERMPLPLSIERMLLPVSVGGQGCFAPAAFQLTELPSGSKVSVPEVVPAYGDFGKGGRYRFIGWSDGGEREHEIEAPAGGGSLTFQMQREFELFTHTNSGEIVVSPESEDGFYPAGSQVQLTAVPAAGHFLGWEYDVSGTEPTQFVIMDRDRRAMATFTRDEPVLVQFGEPMQFDSLAGSHYVRVPDSASQVAVRVESSALMRDAGFSVYSNRYGLGYELGSTRLSESDTITINREALSRIWDNHRALWGSHHLRIQQRGGIGSGTLHVSIQRDWIAHVWPRAFTLVSKVGWSRPVWQTMRIAPVGGDLPQVRYRIVSDQPWLEAVPPEWTSAEGEVEIAVTANGAAMAAEAYAGKLKILTVSDGDPPAGGTPTGIEIPVHFVVRPKEGAEEPPGNESSGLAGGGDHGDTRGAATEIAAGAAARGRIQAVGDEDWFRFRTTAAKTWVTAYTVSEGDTFGELHPDGGDVVTDDDTGSGWNFQITAQVPAGTHYLRVSGFGTPDYTLELEAGILFPMEFERIPAGEFLMGSPSYEAGRESNERQHEVRISQGFWIGKYEVTQGEWQAVMGTTPSHYKRCGSRCPVETVSWDDIQEFIRRLNELESGSGYVYRLPTEAEWEYAARAGTTGARYGELDEIAWYWDNSEEKTHAVGQKVANAWGLHDMLGNVAEWTADRYREYPSGAVTDPQGPETGPLRVFRGASWYYPARYVRSAYRSAGSPGARSGYIGFRLVRTE